MQIKNYINQVQRSKILNFSRYKKIRLDKNEKIDKFSKSFLKNIRTKINSDLLTAYPEVGPLIKLIAKKNNIKKENILLTAGIDNALRTIIEAYTNKKDKVLILHPTFAMTSIYCKLANLNIVKIGYDKNLNLNFIELLKSINKKLKLIILSNPNSPSGTVISKKNLIEIIKKAKKFKIPIVIDEAYFGFCKMTALNFIKKYKNLIITRTFSKIFGLAGLRVGFVASNEKNIKYLSKLKPMYEINAVAVEAAKLILTRNDLVKKYITETNETKKKLIKILRAKDLDYYESHANFLLVNLKKYKSKILNYSKKNNILISNRTPFKNYLRITLGPISYFKKIINLLQN